MYNYFQMNKNVHHNATNAVAGWVRVREAKKRVRKG